MSHLLEDLYIGNVQPAENFSLSSPEYLQAKSTYRTLFESFYHNLSEPSRKEYLSVESAYNNILSFETQEIFAQGFQLGAAIILEVYNR